MSKFYSQFDTNSTLAGARIWLSGSVPEIETSTEKQRVEILEFVRMFCRKVFQGGGHIIHGSSPSFMPIILEEAKMHIDHGGKKDVLILVVSRLWSKDQANFLLDDWRKVSLVYETPEVIGHDARSESLKLLRKWIVARCDGIVVLGGKWWGIKNGIDGIPEELGFAIETGLPCFLLGGLGGATKDFLKRNPNILSKLKNGLTLNANQELSQKDDFVGLADEVFNYLERLPLVRGKGTDGVSFRILALDGGGLKGVFTASALATWEKQTGLRIVDHFDLIAGTSTGGILAIGLGLGLSGMDMLEFYFKRGPIIFPVTRFRNRVWHIIKHLFKPKYAQTILLQELEKGYYNKGKPIFMKDSLCRLVIPSYHAVAGASHIFRTPHHADLTADALTETAHAALATAAAPSFFTAAKIANMVSKSSYFDGGVWANSPALAAIIEAVCYLKIPIERIDILSIGTTDVPFTVRKHTRSGIIGWIWKMKILDLLMNVQQESSLKLARHLVGEPRFMRVNVTTSTSNYKLDSPKEIEELADLGNRKASDPEIYNQIKSRFLNGVKVCKWEQF